MTKIYVYARYIKQGFLSPIEAFIRYLPGPVGNLLRYNFYKRKLKYLGKNVTINEGVYILNPEHISVGENTWIDKNVILAAGKPQKGERKFFWKNNKNYNGQIGELQIGKGCHIAPNAIIQAHGGVEIGDYAGVASSGKIYSMSAHYRNLETENGVLYKFTPRAPQNEQYLIIGPIVMEDNTGLGLNSVILPGVTIGKNSWVGINSYVRNNIPPNSIAFGNPAKIVKKHRIN